jgi:uncharacterized protein
MVAPARMISADSHVRLSHDAVKRHLRTKFHDAYDRGVAAFEQRILDTIGATRAEALAGEGSYSHPAHGRRGLYEGVERLKDMDVDGTDAEIVYCETSSYRYLYLVKDGHIESMRAFNDALDEFASVDPKRLVVAYQISVHDVDAAAGEVRRIAALGGKTLQLPVRPTEFGLPDYYHERYDPLWEAVQETGLPICCHIGLNTDLADLSQRDPTPQLAVMVNMVALYTAESLGMWILGGVFERFPGLKVIFVEPGVAWVPWWLHSVDDMLVRQKYDFSRITQLPSDYFRRNVWLTLIDEPDAIQLMRYRVGVDRILWSTDYPHPVGTWPHSRERIDVQFAGVPEEERDQIVFRNAEAVWGI